MSRDTGRHMPGSETTGFGLKPIAAYEQLTTGSLKRDKQYPLF